MFLLSLTVQTSGLISGKVGAKHPDVKKCLLTLDLKASCTYVIWHRRSCLLLIVPDYYLKLVAELI